MKRVFSKEKWKKLYAEEIMVKWVDKCDGLTREEMSALGFMSMDEWFVDVPSNDLEDIPCLKEIKEVKNNAPLVNKKFITPFITLVNTFDEIVIINTDKIILVEKGRYNGEDVYEIYLEHDQFLRVEPTPSNKEKN